MVREIAYFFAYADDGLRLPGGGGVPIFEEPAEVAICQWDGWEGSASFHFVPESRCAMFLESLKPTGGYSSAPLHFSRSIIGFRCLRKRCRDPVRRSWDRGSE